MTKIIYNGHIKTLSTLLSILTRLSEQEDIQSESLFARITHETVAELEGADSENEVFNRRMGMRHYLKQLRTNMLKVNASKQAREASKLRKA